MVLRPLIDINATSLHLSPHNERSGIIDRIKQDNIDYRGIPDERISSAVHKVQEAYYVDETKLKDSIPDYNVSKRLLDMYI